MNTRTKVSFHRVIIIFVTKVSPYKIVQNSPCKLRYFLILVHICIKTSVESELGKTLELSKIMRMSFLMLDRVNWGHHQKLLGLSYLCEESSHTKSLTPSTFPSGRGGGW